MSRSREGAWIEIKPVSEDKQETEVAPARERGLKCLSHRSAELQVSVAPARERGLKYMVPEEKWKNKESLPRGSVD